MSEIYRISLQGSGAAVSTLSSVSNFVVRFLKPLYPNSAVPLPAVNAPTISADELHRTWISKYIRYLVSIIICCLFEYDKYK